MRNLSVGVAAMVMAGCLMGTAKRAAASGYEFEGLGARQVSKAGAAVASANDWTAMYWNPANITAAAHPGAQVGAEAFGGKVYGKDTNSLSNLPGVGPIFTRQYVNSAYLLGGLGAAVPVGEKGGVAAGFYTPLLQGSDFSDHNDMGMSLDYKSYAGILVWGVAGSYQFLPNFSAGAGINLLYGKLSIKNQLTTPSDQLASNIKADGFGVEGTIGFSYEPVRKIRLGTVFRTGGDANLKGRAVVTSHVLPHESSGLSYELRHPPTFGAGASWQVTERWNAEFDYNRTYWHRFTNQFIYDSPGLLLQNGGNTFHWRDSWKLRFGNEIKITPATDVLAGISYDKGKAVDDQSIDISTSLDTPRTSLAAGVAHRWNERWETVLGAIAGGGSRDTGDVHYDLFGWQLMAEVSDRF